MSSDKQRVPSPEDSSPDIVSRARNVALLADGLRNFLRFHQQLGIDAYPLRDGLLTDIRNIPQQAAVPSPSNPPAQVPEMQRKNVRQKNSVPLPSKGESVEAVLRDIVSCSKCEQAGKRIQPAFAGSGIVKLMIVGDYCLSSSEEIDLLFGEQEDQMLWRMVEALKLQKNEVYVTNCLKCQCSHPPRERKVNMDSCLALLSREVAAVRPRVICAMGAMAGQLLLGTGESVLGLRGRFSPYRYAEQVNVQVMVTFHPRILLTQPELKRAAWEDLQQIQRRFLG